MTSEWPRALPAALIAVAALALGGCGLGAQGTPGVAEASVAAPAAPSAGPPPEVLPTSLATDVRASAPAATASVPRGPAWIATPRIAGRLTSKDIGLVINVADPYSVEVG